jgi:uncharacterized membrane protein YuzA (DUF378 family)
VKARTIKIIGTILRDLGCWAVGIFGVLHQELTGKVNAELLLVYLALLGIPGAVALLQLRGKVEIQDTAEPPSSSLPS